MSGIRSMSGHEGKRGAGDIQAMTVAGNESSLWPKTLHERCDSGRSYLRGSETLTYPMTDIPGLNLGFVGLARMTSPDHSSIAEQLDIILTDLGSMARGMGPLPQVESSVCFQCKGYHSRCPSRGTLNAHEGSIGLPRPVSVVPVL